MRVGILLQVDVVPVREPRFRSWKTPAQGWVDPHRLVEENLNVVLLGLALTHATWTRRNLTNERVFGNVQKLKRGET